MSTNQESAESGPPIESQEHSVPLVFLGGTSYDDHRNRFVGSAAMQLTGHSELITIPDDGQWPDNTVVFQGPDGEEELTHRQAMRRLDDPVEARFARAHKVRAERLNEEIVAGGNWPVDGMVLSVDTATVILAMWAQPELYRHVVLLDPSSIAKLPPRSQYLRQERQNGNIQALRNRAKNPREEERFEEPASLTQVLGRHRRSSKQLGNRWATYYSYQAQMLHEVAVSEDAPTISIVTSKYDLAYTPERILKSLVSLSDINYFFITNYPHGLGGKQEKLEQAMAVLSIEQDRTGSLIDRIGFAEEVSEDYRQRIADIVHEIEQPDQHSS